jgi:DNA polymerase I-like protein with 3'-5' exonuclease and polymerase domains
LDQCRNPSEPSPVEDIKLRFNGVLRGLWRAEPGAFLVGADAEGIQLRILAHLINDPDYRKTIEKGDKKNKTDIHNVNMRSLAPHCKSRDDAKTFIYAWVLNAQAARVSGILGCSFIEAREAMRMFLEANPALKEYKHHTIPQIAKKRYFEGLDGRLVVVPSEHKVLAGELQNGESVVMKHATILWRKWADEDGLRYKLVDDVHDEWQSEVYDREVGHRLGQLKCDALIKTGQELGVRCALAGDYDIGINWRETH